jgi:fructose-bisphosphate aldolase class 1
MDGDHSIERSFEVTSRTLHAVFTELRDQRVHPEGMLLKPNMVLSGYEQPEQASHEQVAERRSAASSVTSRPPCRASSSSRAASRTKTRPRTSTR